MSMFKRVLVATDFSESAEVAVNAVARIAGELQPQVRLLHVIAPLPIGRLTPFVPVGVSPEEVIDDMRARAAKQMNKLRRECFDGVPNTTMDIVVHPHTASAICEAADVLPADLIAVGTHGLAGASRLLFGSVAERVVRHASSSVLVVHPEAAPIRHILCAIDFSPTSILALDAARDWAATFGAKLTLFHVADDMSGLTRPLEVAEPTLFAEHERALLEESLTELDTLRRRHFPAAHEHEVAIDAMTGLSPADTICGYAAKNEVDLIVVGTLGRTGLSRWLVGSVAERVVRHSQRAVLVVRPQASH